MINYWIIPAVAKKNIQFKSSRIDEVIEETCIAYKISKDALYRKTKLRMYVEPRQVIFYILHKKFDIQLQKIGFMFNKHHATILHGANNIENIIPFDHELKEKINKIINK
jgi:chromosomal replication initiation ATPase DnaA